MKLTDPWQDWQREKREKTWIIIIGNEAGNHNSSFHLKTIIKEYYIQHHTHTFDNLDEIKNRKYHSHKIWLDNLSNFITIKGIGFLVWKLLQWILQTPMVSAENSGKHLKKKITLILHNFFWKIGKEVAFPHSLYDASITLIAKPVKASYNTNSRPISVMNMDAKSLFF